MRRRATHIADSEDDLHRAAFDIIGGRDETAQMRSRKIRPGGSEAGVALCHLAVITGCGAGSVNLFIDETPLAFLISDGNAGSKNQQAHPHLLHLRQ